MATPARWTNSKRPRSTGAPRAGGIGIQLVNLDEVLDGFNDLKVRVDRATRPAAQAAAQILHDEAKSNAARLTKSGPQRERMNRPGALYDSIYHVFSKDNSTRSVLQGFSRAEYHVSWNWAKAPHAHLVEWGHMQPYKTYHTKDGRILTQVKPDKLAEFFKAGYGRGKTVPEHLRPYYFVPMPGGPRQIPAYPFMRAAIAAKSTIAMDRMSDILWEAIGV